MKFRFRPLYILLTASISCLTFANLVSALGQDSNLNVKDKDKGGSLGGVNSDGIDPRDKRMINIKLPISLSDRMKKALQDKLHAPASAGDSMQIDREANPAKKILLQAAQSKTLGSFSGSASLVDASLSKRNIEKHPTDELKLSLTNMDYLEEVNVKPGTKPPPPQPPPPPPPMVTESNEPTTGTNHPTTGPIYGRPFFITGLLNAVDLSDPSDKEMVEKAEDALNPFEAYMTLGKGESCSPDSTPDVVTVVNYFGSLGVNFKPEPLDLDAYIAKVNRITSYGEALCDYRNLQLCDKENSTCSNFIRRVVSEETSGPKIIFRLASGELCFDLPEIYDTHFEVLCTEKAQGTCSRTHPEVCTCPIGFSGDLCETWDDGGGITIVNPSPVGNGSGGDVVDPVGAHKGLGAPCQDDMDCDDKNHLECQGQKSMVRMEFSVQVSSQPEYFVGLVVDGGNEVRPRIGRSIDFPQPHPPRPRKRGGRRRPTKALSDEPIFEEDPEGYRPRNENYPKGPGNCGCTKDYAPTWYYVQGDVYKIGCGKSVGQPCRYGTTVTGENTRECASHRCIGTGGTNLVCTRSLAGLLFIPSIYRPHVTPHESDKPAYGVAHHIDTRSVSTEPSRYILAGASTHRSAGASRKEISDALTTTFILNIFAVFHALNILDA